MVVKTGQAWEISRFSGVLDLGEYILVNATLDSSNKG